MTREQECRKIICDQIVRHGFTRIGVSGLEHTGDELDDMAVRDDEDR